MVFLWSSFFVAMRLIEIAKSFNKCKFRSMCNSLFPIWWYSYLAVQVYIMNHSRLRNELIGNNRKKNLQIDSVKLKICKTRKEIQTFPKKSRMLNLFWNFTLDRSKRTKARDFLAYLRNLSYISLTIIG